MKATISKTTESELQKDLFG
jgi:hypothetical protein